MAQALRKRRHWRIVRPPSSRFHLLIGDRWTIKYSRLTGKREYGMTQMVNYFKGSHCLTLKASMVRSLKAALGPEKTFALTPMSFLLRPRGPPADEPPRAPPPSQGDGDEGTTSSFECERSELRERMAELPDSLWIAKPSAGSKGQGILITASYEDIAAHVDRCERRKEVFVVQRYLERPLLINGRKFDIRCWVLLVAPYDIYLYNQASLRTASEVYDTTQLDQTLAHLTNHCLQLDSPNFGKWEPGNEMWWWQFDDYLRPTGHSVEKDILPQIKTISTECLLSVHDRLRLQSDYLAFQLFGFDFMIDESFRVWLLEINGSPASADVLRHSIVEGLIRTCIDPVYPSSLSTVPDPLPAVEGMGVPQFELLYKHPTHDDP